jgi:hypothetical protein
MEYPIWHTGISYGCRTNCENAAVFHHSEANRRPVTTFSNDRPSVHTRVFRALAMFAEQRWVGGWVGGGRSARTRTGWVGWWTTSDGLQKQRACVLRDMHVGIIIIVIIFQDDIMIMITVMIAIIITTMTTTTTFPPPKPHPHQPTNLDGLLHRDIHKSREHVH